MKTRRKRSGPRVSITLHQAAADAIASIRQFIPCSSQAEVARFLIEEAAYAIDDYINKKRAAGWGDKGIEYHSFYGSALRFEYTPCSGSWLNEHGEHKLERRAIQREKDHEEATEKIENLLASVGTGSDINAHDG